MELANFKETIQPIFDKLQLDAFDFDYDKENNWLVSKDSYIDQENREDTREHFIVVRFKDGAVLSGTSDGINFFEEEVLGYMSIEDNKWVLKSIT